VAKTAGIQECAYVQSSAAPEVEFFSTLLDLGPEGIAKIHPIPTLTEGEQALYAAAIPELKASIQKGVDFVKKPSNL
jgi:malate dehydrogenase